MLPLRHAAADACHAMMLPPAFAAADASLSPRRGSAISLAGLCRLSIIIIISFHYFAAISLFLMSLRCAPPRFHCHLFFQDAYRHFICHDMPMPAAEYDAAILMPLFAVREAPWPFSLLSRHFFIFYDYLVYMRLRLFSRYAPLPLL